MRHLVLAYAGAIGTTTACTAQAHALAGKDPCEVIYLTALYGQQERQAVAKARKACWSMYT